jgi:cytochrome c oxidase subunit 1
LLVRSTLFFILNDPLFVYAKLETPLRAGPPPSLVGGTVMAYMAGLHYWWPNISGRMYPEGWGKAAALIILVGFILTFLPQFVLGYLGMPRRFHGYPPEFQVLNVMSSAGASILAVGYVLPLVYLIWSLCYGKKAGPNPCGVNCTPRLR